MAWRKDQSSDRSWRKTDPNHRRDGERNRSHFSRELCESGKRVDSSCKKRPREDELVHQSCLGHRGGAPEPFPKKFHLSRDSDHVRRGSIHHERKHCINASPYPSTGRYSQRRHKSDHHASKLGQDCSKHPQSREKRQEMHAHERERGRRRFANDYTSSSSSWRRESERDSGSGNERYSNYRDRSPVILTRHREQLPVGGATSSRSRPEAVPCSSSKASGGTGNRRDHSSTMKEQGSLMKVLSMVDSAFVPSLPKKYYSFESDQVRK